MVLRIKYIMIIIVLFISILINNIDLELIAEDSKNDLFGQTSLRFDPTNVEDYDWKAIEVISEPSIDQNNNNDTSKNVKLAVEYDNVYMVWEDNTSVNDAGSDYDIFYRYFNGDIWSEVQVISEPVLGRDFNKGASGLPSICVNNGKVYVMWVDDNNTNGAGTDYDIFYRCNLTGSSWEDIQVISEPVFGENKNIRISFNPDITVENGKIFTVWQDDTNILGAELDDDIFFRCNLTGSTWEDIQIISEPMVGSNINIAGSSIPKIAVENDKVYVVWTDGNDTNGAGTDYDIFYRCNLTGKVWEPVQVISEPEVGNNTNDRWSYYPALAVEDSKIHVVWVDCSNTSGAMNDSDIFYINNLTGLGWEPIQVISEPILSKDINIDGSFNPAIDVEDGRIYVVWDDMNNTNGAGNNSEDIFLRYNLTGNSWEDVFVISEPIIGGNLSIYASFNPDIIIDHGLIYVAWHDYNNIDGAGSDYDIFYRRTFLPISLNLPKVTPSVGNTGTEFNFTVKYTHLDNIAPKEIAVNIDGSNYSLIEANPTDTIYTNGKFYYYTMTHLDIGSNHVFQFWASDNENTIIKRPINKPDVYNTQPIIITEDDKIAIENEYYEIIYNYEDIDVANVGQIITWDFSTNASWLSFNTTTAVLYGTPTRSDVGKYWVNIILTDGFDIDFTNFTLIVHGVENSAPILSKDSIAPTLGDTDTEYTFSIHYYDHDSDVPTFIHVVIDNESNSMELLSGYSSNGIYMYKTKLPEGEHVYYFISSDGLEIVRTANLSTFTLPVYIPPNNVPRLIEDKMEPASGDINTEFTFSIHYYDLDFEAPAFVHVVIDNRSYSMNLITWNSSDGIYIYKTKVSEGEHNYYFTCSDGIDLTRTANFTSPYIKKPGKVSSDDLTWQIVILIAIFVIIIILFIILLIRIRLKHPEQKKKKG